MLGIRNCYARITDRGRCEFHYISSVDHMKNEVVGALNASEMIVINCLFLCRSNVESEMFIDRYFWDMSLKYTKSGIKFL